MTVSEKSRKEPLTAEETMQNVLSKNAGTYRTVHPISTKSIFKAAMKGGQPCQKIKLEILHGRRITDAPAGIGGEGGGGESRF